MRITVLSLLLATGLVCCLGLSGCGVKPHEVDPPASVDPNKDYFPHTYPDPATDPDPERYIRR
ncbi:MAG: hypothetical protein PW788_14760 [Micavibrio sp.]|nr:hypothetical protein [Micavibrio sp.]